MSGTFENAIKGDRVWSQTFGWGRVAEVTECYVFPLHVRFDTGLMQKFKVNGEISHHSVYPDLFWDEPKELYPVVPRPRRARFIDWSKVPVGTLVWVTDGEEGEAPVVERFVAFIDGNDAPYVCCPMDKPIEQTKVAIMWKSCWLHEDVEVNEEWVRK